ncbi:MAG: SAM-dependent methyltransferase [Nitrospinaceae bacterium]|nr:MAG: SAM-dependent methyltransferase [Nitrospinaceae bacterium]
MDIEQNAQGYRYSIEPFLLANFIHLEPGFEVLDIGTGCGVIPLLLMTREPQLQIIAVEIQKSLNDLARQNVAKNGLLNHIQVIHGNFSQVAETLGNDVFDLVISNPPYRKRNTGRTNPNEEKAIARHELLLNLHSILKDSACLLKAGGKIALTYPPHRLSEVLSEMKNHELFPSRLRFIHGSRGTDAKIFLVEGIKGCQTNCSVEPPLYVYKENNSFTEEMEHIYDSFDHTDRSDDIGEKRCGSGVG